MASLTTLPAEILRQILIDTLLSQYDPPTGPPESQDRVCLHGSGGVWLKTKSLENPTIALLLVNRLVNQHVQSITATEYSLHNYALDVMFVKLAGLWPTWTRVPVLTQNVNTVHATFRIFNPGPELDSKFHLSGRLGHGNGGAHCGVWNPYDLLTSFLDSGPLARSASRPAARRVCHYTIRNLIIDVSSPPEDEDHTITGPGVLDRRWTEQEIDEMFSLNWDEQQIDETFSLGRDEQRIHETFSLVSQEGWQRPPATEPRVEPAEKLGIFLHGWMRDLLMLGSNTDYATILYEGILDGIEFRVNGELRCHIDMENWLSVVEPEYRPQRERGQRERFRQWKQWVTEKRSLSRLERGAPGKRPHNSILYFKEP